MLAICPQFAAGLAVLTKGKPRHSQENSSKPLLISRRKQVVLLLNALLCLPPRLDQVIYVHETVSPGQVTTGCARCTERTPLPRAGPKSLSGITGPLSSPVLSDASVCTLLSFPLSSNPPPFCPSMPVSDALKHSMRHDPLCIEHL